MVALVTVQGGRGKPGQGDYYARAQSISKLVDAR